MSETRQVEFTEDPYAQIGKSRFYMGDRITLPKAEADQYIGVGWCKCVETGETGERSTKPVKMAVDDAFLASQ